MTLIDIHIYIFGDPYFFVTMFFAKIFLTFYPV